MFKPSNSAECNSQVRDNFAHKHDVQLHANNTMQSMLPQTRFQMLNQASTFSTLDPIRSNTKSPLTGVSIAMPESSILEDILSGVSSPSSAFFARFSVSILRSFGFDAVIGLCPGCIPAMDSMWSMSLYLRLSCKTCSMLLKYFAACQRDVRHLGGFTYLHGFDLKLKGGVFIHNDQWPRVELECRESPHVVHTSLNALLQGQGLVRPSNDNDDLSGVKDGLDTHGQGHSWHLRHVVFEES